MAKISAILLVNLVFLLTVSAIYEDQIGKFDWKRSYIGKVSSAKFVPNHRRVVVATEQNVLASLSAKNGEIQWRQLLEDPTEHKIYHLQVAKDITVISGTQNLLYVRNFDLNSGSLQFEWSVAQKTSDQSYWSIIGSDEIIQVTPVLKSHLEVVKYNFKTGERIDNTKKPIKIEAPWLSDTKKCLVQLSQVVCISNGLLYRVDLASESLQVKSESIENLTGDRVTNEAYLSDLNEEKSLILLNSGSGKSRILDLSQPKTQSPPYELPEHLLNVDDYNYFLEGNPENPEKLVKVRRHRLEATKSQDENVYEIEYPLGLGAPVLLAGACPNQNCELLLSSSDDALSLVRLSDGKVVWTREEALSSIVAVEFFELPISELDASIENEFDSNPNDIFGMLIHRLSTQYNQFQKFVFGGHFSTSGGLIRDEFGLHQLIVVATSVGKLFGIDTLTGSIVWSYRLVNTTPFTNNGEMSIVVLRTARFSPYPAKAVLIGRDSRDGNAILFEFDPISGKSDKGVRNLGYKIKQTLSLPQEDHQHIRPLIIVDEFDKIHVYPESTDKLLFENFAGKLFIYILNDKRNQVDGYQLDPINGGLKLVWNSNFNGATVASISTRPVTERVHSQGRVLHDRSVYYKYVNPNLIAIATVASSTSDQSNVLSVYLIDGVTGLIVYATSHSKIKGPVHLVHSENWFVYSFFNERFRRFELVSGELYEGHILSNSSVFSSYAVSLLPLVQTQSYIMPVAIETMTVTLTERGITSKFLLVGLSSGSVVEIPWMLVQPRFPDFPCGPEENCIPYMPEIPLPDEVKLNYNQTLGRIRKVSVAPARLESTSHVLCDGLDLFYTRVAPSKTFDVLKEDFDHRLIVLVLSGLIVASYVTKYLAAKKALRQAWK